MPTDGADFGRMKSCYGRVYTALREGADEADVAELAIRGVERDIRREGGAPAFGPAVDLVVLISSQIPGSTPQMLVRNTDSLSRVHADRSLTRHILSAAEKVALGALGKGTHLSQHEAAGRSIAQIARGHCEGMSGYVTRHRTGSIAATEVLSEAVSDKLGAAPSLSDFAPRMLNASAKGYPAKAPRIAQIDHSADHLNNASLDDLP